MQITSIDSLCLKNKQTNKRTFNAEYQSQKGIKLLIPATPFIRNKITVFYQLLQTLNVLFGQ